MKRTKLRAASTLLLLAIAIPALGHAAKPLARECGAVGCGTGWSVAGGIAIGILTIGLTPVAGIAAGAVFAA